MIYKIYMIYKHIYFIHQLQYINNIQLQIVHIYSYVFILKYMYNYIYKYIFMWIYTNIYPHIYLYIYVY